MKLIPLLILSLILLLTKESLASQSYRTSTTPSTTSPTTAHTYCKLILDQTECTGAQVHRNSKNYSCIWSTNKNKCVKHKQKKSKKNKRRSNKSKRSGKTKRS